MSLLRLLRGLDSSRFENVVISLTDCGAVGRLIEELGVTVVSLDLKTYPFNILRCLSPEVLRELRADILQGWMYHGNLAATAAVPLTRQRSRLFWNVRHSLSDLGNEELLTRWTIRCGALFSRRPHEIIYNSVAAARQHEALGYSSAKTVVVPNGFDLDEFSPVPGAGEWLRKELGCPPESVLVGCVARFHPNKDHANFLKAAGLVARQKNHVHFVLCGRGVDRMNSQLLDAARSWGIERRTHFLGERNDLPRLFSGLDIAVLPSLTEGFPNVVGEAMACGTPCVVTDVGDSALLVDKCGRVVPPRAPGKIAAALLELLELDPAAKTDLDRLARQRIADTYSLQSTINSYEKIYSDAKNFIGGKR